MLKRIRNYFTAGEIALWGVSAGAIVVSFLIFDRSNPWTLAASLIGITSLLFNAKGNPTGQALMILFSLLYGYISYTFSYYGEMLTYLGMSMPMAVFALVSWLRHPYQGQRSEVQVNTLRPRELLLMIPVTVAVTVAFGFLLAYFHTANLLPSTLSVTTSFAAVYLTFRRSPLFGLAYAANDLVLILLWTLASITDARYISVVVCFAAFFVHDIYGFLSWQKRRRRQGSVA